MPDAPDWPGPPWVGALAPSSRAGRLPVSIAAGSNEIDFGKSPAIILPESGDVTGLTDRQVITAIIAEIGTGTILLPPGTFYVDQLDALAGTNGITLCGCGVNVTSLVFTSAGGIADLTNTSFFSCRDMTIRPVVQRTAEYFHLDATTGTCQMNSFRRLRVASPYKFASLNLCSTTTIEDIQLLDQDSAWGINAGISLDGTATSTVLRGLRADLASAVTQALVNIVGTNVDTVQGQDWDFTFNSGASQTCLNITAGEWIHLANISLEAGSAEHAAIIGGTAKGISLQGVHLLGLHGLHISGGKGVEVVGGEILSCQQEGVYVLASTAMQDLTLADLDISDCGLAATNTYPAIHFTGGFNYFRAVGCAAGNNRLLGSANRVSYGIQVDAGSDYYVLANNQCEGATGGVLDNGGGTHKIVSNI